MFQSIRVFIILLSSLFIFDNAFCCSAFSTMAAASSENILKSIIQPYALVGKDFDWYIGKGEIFKNRSGMQKVALTPKDSKPLTWISKWSSLTFNQFGVDFSLSGINEKGLVVEVLVQNGAKDPQNKMGYPTLNEMQVVQFLLDEFESVDEITQHLQDFQMASVSHIPLHYFICDVKTCGALEVFEGKITLMNASDVPALTNTAYPDSRSYLSQFAGFGGSEQIPTKSLTSLDRFVQVSALSKQLTSEDIEGVFELLSRVAMPDNQWQIVYDRNQSVVFFKTQIGKFKPFNVSIKDLHQNCSDTQSEKFTTLQSFKEEKIDSTFEALTQSKNDAIITQFANDYKKYFDPRIFEDIKKVYLQRKCIH